MKKTHSSVIKARSISVLKDRGTKTNADRPSGELRPYVSLAECLTAWRSSPYHQAAVKSKADFSVGMGYELYDLDGNLSDELTTQWETLWPEGFQDSMDRIALDFEVFANAFVEVKADGISKFPVSAMYHVPAATMAIFQTGDTREYKQRVDNKIIKTFAQSDGVTPGILHFSQYSPAATVFGEPEWVSALKPISLDTSATTYNDNFFKNNCVPQWAIIVEADIDEGTETEIQNFFNTEFKGLDNVHKTLLLSGGGKVEFTPLQTGVKDMNFERLKQICRDETAAAHNIPPRLMGIVSAGSLGGTGEMQWQLRFFENGKLQKRRNMYESQFNKMLKAFGSIKFLGLDLSLDIEDAQYYGTLVTNGILSPATARRDMGFEEERTTNARLLEGFLNEDKSV